MSSQRATPRKSYRFADRVAAAKTKTYTAKVEQDATVEEVRVRIYQGPRLDLHVAPYVAVQGRASDPVALILHEGKQYVDGDDDYFRFPVSEAVEEGDLLGVEVTNEDASHAYDFAVDILLDEEGGVSRPLTSVIDRVRGWL